AMLRLWLNQLARRLFPRSRRGRRRPYLLLPSRPRVEPLEIRVVPTTNSFNNTDLNGLWNDANNWSLGHTPTSAEDVSIDASFNVTAPTGTTIVNSVSLSGTLNLQGTLTLSAASTISATGTLDLSTNDINSVIDGNGSLTNNGSISNNQN